MAEREDFCGTWSLDRFWFTDDAGVEVDPLGQNPVGHLILGADGNYAFTMMRRDRTPFRNGDVLGGSEAEKGEAADGYVSFGGAWRFAGDAIEFDILYSFCPNWVGGTQRRLAIIEDSTLTLRTQGPILLAGKIHRGAARWHRARVR